MENDMFYELLQQYKDFQGNVRQCIADLQNKIIELERLNKELTENSKKAVVRCKNCIYYKEGTLLSPNKFCFRLKYQGKNVGYNFSPDDFCSYGVRMDGDKR